MIRNILWALCLTLPAAGAMEASAPRRAGTDRQVEQAVATGSPARDMEREEKGKTMESERYTRGLAMLRTIDGSAGEAVVDSLADIAPDFARYLVEYPFGDIYSRPDLDLKSREIAVVAALTALGNARPQLKVHIGAALNVGCSREELVEIIMMMSVYAGFPAALNGLSAAREVFAEHGAN